jgi:hypothetical protein
MNQDICREYPTTSGLDLCMNNAKAICQNSLIADSKYWWMLLAFVVVSIPVIYGCCRGLAAIGLWIWHGFLKPVRRSD